MILGGRSRKLPPRHGKKAVWRWEVFGPGCEAALTALLPYLTTKQAEAEVLLRYLRSRDHTRPRGQPRARREQERLEKARRWLQELKRRPRVHVPSSGASTSQRAARGPRTSGAKGEKKMPAKSKAQLRKAYAACNRGEDWGCEMAEKTKSTKGLPERKGAPKKKGKK